MKIWFKYTNHSSPQTASHSLTQSSVYLLALLLLLLLQHPSFVCNGIRLLNALEDDIMTLFEAVLVNTRLQLAWIH
jgi:hypothetical protein